MKKITIILFAAGLLSCLVLHSCKKIDSPITIKNKCYTCTYTGYTVTNICDDDVIDKQYYENAGYVCTAE